MKFIDILNIAQNDDELQHLRTLISARGAKMDEEIDQNFMEVLEEEGYRVEEVI